MREGQQLGVGQEEWTHIAEPGVPGSMSFDTAVNWQRVVRCIGKALNEAGVSGDKVRAVSSTSMREAIVLYDGAGKEVWACANVDSRAEAEVRELKARQGSSANSTSKAARPSRSAPCPASTGCASTSRRPSNGCAPSPCSTTG